MINGEGMLWRATHRPRDESSQHIRDVQSCLGAALHYAGDDAPDILHAVLEDTRSSCVDQGRSIVPVALKTPRSPASPELMIKVTVTCVTAVSSDRQGVTL